MPGYHPGEYRGFIWACAEFEANLDQKCRHQQFGYDDFKECEAALAALRLRYADLIRKERFDRPLKRRASKELRRCEMLFTGYWERVFDAFEGSTYH